MSKTFLDYLTNTDSFLNSRLDVSKLLAFNLLLIISFPFELYLIKQ